jgi:zinc transporter, ZIP family
MNGTWLASFTALSPAQQALAAGLFCWALTAAGATTVFFVARVHRRVLDAMLGASAGIMLAASYWSLLAPAIAIDESRGGSGWAPAAIGFVAGAATMFGLDKALPHLHPGLARERAEGPATTWQRSVLLVLAITLHNIPEGLAVGVAFGAAGIEGSPATLGAALALALGIAIQNVPEGLAVALPLRAEGKSRWRSFGWGQLSAVVEPVAAVAGAAAVAVAAPLLPYALAFAAGAMIYVVVEELIPETDRAGNIDLATLCLVAGFTLMMILDTALD